MSLEQVAGAGGVPLAVRSHGSGPPIVLVHGTIGSSGDWVRVTALLAEHFRVVSYDRRGRGRSGDGGDGGDHDIALEVDDLLAVVGAVGEPVHVVAHSFGAIIAMAAAGRSGARSHFLYEPPIGLDGTRPQLPEIRAASAAGDRARIAQAFFALAGATQTEVAALEATPAAWRAVLDAAPTVERELRTIVRENARGPVDVPDPVAVLTGALTNDRIFLDGLDELVRRWGARRLDLPRQRHLGLVFDPESTATVIRRWIETVPDR